MASKGPRAKEDAAPAIVAPVQAAAAPPEAAPVPEASPSMAQFLEIKAANPDSLLWYRMGDFYELFFDDAVVASAALGIVLTKRGKHLGEDIPMCGVPIHRADEYLQRLIRLGYRVAVAEQLEDPADARKRGSKAVVRRDVVRLVTPGTLTEDALLDAKARNYLTALFRAPGPAASAGMAPDATVALASVDISTGEFEVGEIKGADLPGELSRLAPGEVILVDQLLGDAALKRWIEHAGAAATPVPGAYFDSLAGEANLKAQLRVAELGAFGTFTRAELAAIAAVLKYVELTQIGRKPVLRPPQEDRLRRRPADRRRQPREPRADPLNLRRQAWQPTGGDRSHRDGGRRPRAGGAARKPAARPAPHRQAPRRRRVSHRSGDAARRPAPGPARGPGHRPRGLAPRLRARLAARSRRRA